MIRSLVRDAVFLVALLVVALEFLWLVVAALLALPRAVEQPVGVTHSVLVAAVFTRRVRLDTAALRVVRGNVHVTAERCHGILEFGDEVEGFALGAVQSVSNTVGKLQTILISYIPHGLTHKRHR